MGEPDSAEDAFVVDGEAVLVARLKQFSLTPPKAYLDAPPIV